jgi:hypothetical protein
LDAPSLRIEKTEVKFLPPCVLAGVGGECYSLAATAIDSEMKMIYGSIAVATVFLVMWFTYKIL